MELEIKINTYIYMIIYIHTYYFCEVGLFEGTLEGRRRRENDSE
jgi:hypothetical protein